MREMTPSRPALVPTSVGRSRPPGRDVMLDSQAEPEFGIGVTVGSPSEPRPLPDVTEDGPAPALTPRWAERRPRSWPRLPVQRDARRARRGHAGPGPEPEPEPEP